MLVAPDLSSMDSDEIGALEGIRLGGWFTFDGAAEVRLQLALSNVDTQGALDNLEAEDVGLDVRAAARAAQAEWADWLSVISVWGGTDDERTIFATALFHALQMPTVFSDVDGRYRGFDDEIHTADGFRFHTDFSLWDTYRTLHPLMTLLWPDAHLDMLQSLAMMTTQSDGVPRWPLANKDTGTMLGAPGEIVFAEAWRKGLRDFDVQTLQERAVSVALGEVVPVYGRPDVALYETHGYYPSDEVGRSVAWTQEVAIADYALAIVESEIGDPDVAQQLFERAGFWENLYDPEVGFFHGRASDGTFDAFSSEALWSSDYAEGNARQYLWLVPHDPEGLFSVMGGSDVAISRLTTFFEETREEDEDGYVGMPDYWYWHGNEPDIHAPWLFALAGEPELTRKWVRWVMENRYGTGADGLAGNDDAGTLSAWYVFAAMGLYPLAGTDRYILGEPAFSRIEFPVGEGKFTIMRVGNGDTESVWLNGVAHVEPDILHADLVAGGSLVFWGSDIR